MEDAVAEPGSSQTPAEGLRQRKKRLTRQQISDVATKMFLERGFDEVRVTEVAAASGVSEKTVYNYFPTKESLLLDREDEMVAAIRFALGPASPDGSPIEAVLGVLERERNAWLAAWEGNAAVGIEQLRRFSDLIEGTPSLRAAQRDLMDRLGEVAAAAMAERAGVSPEDPEPRIAALAILGLWRIQFEGLRRYAEDGLTPAELLVRVGDDVHRAARLLDGGLWAFSVMVSGTTSRDQLRVAGVSAQRAARQVATAMRQARDAWRQAQQEFGHGGPGGGHRRDGTEGWSQQQLLEQWKRDHKDQLRQAAIAQHEQRHRARRERPSTRKSR